MRSSEADIIEIPVFPQSPVTNWPRLDDLPSNCSGFIESQNENISCDEVVEQRANIPDLNQAPPRSRRISQGRRKYLSAVERLSAYECLLERTRNGVLRKTASRDVAVLFGVGIRTIQRLWKRVRESNDHDPATTRVHNCGRKRVELDLERIREIPLSKRTTNRSLAFALGVSKTFICDKLKEGAIRWHNNSIKPSLTEDNKTSRVNYCLSHFEPATVPLQPTFTQMENTIHIDEKWFYLTKKSQTYYLLSTEEDPVRKIRNGNFIPKVMFLAVVARPRHDSSGFCTFDGKIGIFPLVHSVAAARSSQNRPRGTIEIKPIGTITRNIIRDFMISKVLPAIANKWPRESIMDDIFIQQDNAKSHIQPDDVEFLYAVQASGLKVSLVCQPPNSPDLNVLDLGFFRAIQSLQSRECAKSIIELVAAVEEAYEAFSVKKSNYIFLTLQTCMVEVLKHCGANVYKIPHMKKDALQRADILPPTLTCCLEIYATAINHVSTCFV